MSKRKADKRTRRRGKRPPGKTAGTKPKRIQIGHLAGGTLAFMLLWLAAFFVIRLFCYSAYSLENGGLGRILILGVAWDAAGGAVILPAWLAVQILFARRSIARYFLLILMVPACAFGIINALFVVWAHAPLDPTFLTYADSLGDLSVSARGLLPSWYWVAVFSIAVLGVLFGAWLYGFLRSRAVRFSKRVLVVAAVAVAVLVGVSVIFHCAEDEPPVDVRAMAANPVWHFLEFALTSKTDQLGQAGYDDQTNRLADRLRKSLITDQGIFRHLDDRYPLMKHNFSFSRRGRRKGVWDRSRKIRPNVVVLFLESFRALDIGAYGSSDGLTPTFDRLAEKGWLWENFYANGVQTPRGALAALCSFYPCMSKSIGRANPSLPLRGLASILKEHRYQTEFYHNGALAFDNKVPFFRNLGFDVILGKDALDPQRKYDHHGGWGYGDVIFAGQLAERLNRQPPGRPLLITAFTVSTHHPWEVPDPRLKIVPETPGQYPRYKNCMHYSDHAIKVFFQNLSEHALNNTLFVILSDTAQPMGEHHNNFALIRYLYEENLRIPLLIYAPGYIKEGGRFPEIASQVDVTPTILDMLGIKCDNSAVGRSLLSVVDDPSAIFSNPYFEGWVGARKGRYKYILQLKGNREFLFDLESDPSEMKNIISTRRGIASALKARVVSSINATQHLIQRERIWKSGAGG